MHTGCQWKNIPIEKDESGKPEIHYTSIFKIFRYWVKEGCFDKIFDSTIMKLFKEKMLDTSTAAKKRWNNLGLSGHKRHKGDKVVIICDKNCNIITQLIKAPGNRNETVLLTSVLDNLVNTTKKIGIEITNSVISLDGGYSSKKNRKRIFNLGMKPNIPENKRNRKKSKRGRKQMFDIEIFKERFRTIERVFA
jgi:hypothetical protein